MNCPICKVSEPELGFTTVALERAGSIIVFKDVPAQICPNCGEKYFDAEFAELADRLLTQAQNAVMKRAELKVIHL